jgi:hypothetical protein
VIVGYLEFTGVDGDQVSFEQSQLLIKHDDMATNASVGVAVVFSAIGDDLEVHIKRTFNHIISALRRGVRLNAAEIAVDVDLQQDRGTGKQAGKYRLELHLQKTDWKVKFVEKYLDYAHQIDIADVVVEALGK